AVGRGNATGRCDGRSLPPCRKSSSVAPVGGGRASDSSSGGVNEMVEHTWSKPGGALEVLSRVRLEPEAVALLAAGHTPAAFVAVLAEGGHHADAARFAAFALPRREAVAWACRCARAALGADAPPTAWDALHAAERWVAAPS